MRLDVALVYRGLSESRAKAQADIKEGNVKVNSKTITKCSYECSEDDVLEIFSSLKYVSRGGLKLEKALKEFKINPLGMTCLDIGSSTGGFTDCLIQSGAKEVYAVDVGKDQMHPVLRTNPKVHLYEETNFLTFPLESLPKIDLIVTDVSFIKVETILDRVIKEFRDCEMIFLLKPQFELGNVYIKNGVVKDPKLHELVKKQIYTYLNSKGVSYTNAIDSPIKGGSGNSEFLIKIKV